MSFSDHKITQFTHKITDLPDQPNLPADELKARFDSSPEELRTAHNAVCDDAQTLSNKVDSIITQTFEGVVDKSMLAESLADELDAKADETSVASRFSAEQSAPESTDTMLQTTVAQKCELYCGTYTGTGVDNRLINLNFKPKAVLVMQNGYIADKYDNGYQNANGGIAISGWSGYGIALANNGFTVRQTTEYTSTNGLNSMQFNMSGTKYVYLAFK